MKKFLKIMAAAAVLLCGLALTGCGAAQTIKETVIESVTDSYNNWYKYKSTKQIDIPMFDSSITNEDENTDENGKLKDAQIYFNFNPDTGLKIAVQSVTKQEVSLLGGLYSQNMDIVVGDTYDVSLTKFGKKSWYTLWGSGKLEKADAPKIVTNPSECIIIGGEKAPKSKIHWKKFLANYLLGSLLDD